MSRRYKEGKLNTDEVCPKHQYHFPLKYSRLIVTPVVQIGHHYRFSIVLQDLIPLNNITSPERQETTQSIGWIQIMLYHLARQEGGGFEEVPPLTFSLSYEASERLRSVPGAPEKRWICSEKTA